jgi:WD40 repeat protein
MGLFSADERFMGGLERAWEQAGGPIRGAVGWTLETLDGPVAHIEDVSSTAPFTVLIDELRRTHRRFGWLTTVRRLRRKTAIIGGVDSEGRMTSVSGYPSKFAAAKSIERVVVPANDEETARKLQSDLEPDTQIKAVETWRIAAKQVRKAHSKQVIVQSTAIGAVSALAALGIYILEESQAEREREILALAEHVAEEAWNLDVGEGDGLNLLLAMASDDIAAKVGETTTNFADMARDNSTLVKILRAPHGSYEEPAISEDGGHVLLSTDTGIVQLASTKDGEILWEHEYPPGVQMSEEQTHITAVAFSPYGDQAAIATSDRSITLLADEGEAWETYGSLQLPVEEQTGLLGYQRNALDQLSYSPDGSQLIGYGSNVGLYRYDLEDTNAPPQRCDPPISATDLAANEGGPLLASEVEVIQVRADTCAFSKVLEAPDGVTIHAVGTDVDGAAIAAATRGAQVFMLLPDQTEVFLDDAGPFHDVLITSAWDGPHISGTTETGTLGWLLSDRGKEFGYAGAEYARYTMEAGIWTHGGIAEIHDRAGTPARVFSEPGVYALEVAWAGEYTMRRAETYIAFAPMTANGIDTANGGILQAPANTEIDQMAGNSKSPWVATIVSDQDTRGRSLLLWNLSTEEQIEVDTDGVAPLQVMFSDGDLFVVDSGANLRRYHYQDGEWTQIAWKEFARPARAIASSDGNDSVYVVMADSSNDEPTVVRIDKSNYAVRDSIDLDGAINSVDLTVLEDGQVVVGYGPGIVAFLDPDLLMRGTYTNSDFSTITDVSEVPGFGRLLVMGPRGTAVLNTVTRISQAYEWTRGGPFVAAAASPDGSFLATSNYVGATFAIWSLDNETLREQVCEAVGRELTVEEWLTFVGHLVPYRPVCDQ